MILGLILMDIRKVGQMKCNMKNMLDQIWFRANEGADVACRHQQRHHQQTKNKRMMAASAIINAISINRNIHHINILRNQFDLSLIHI